MHPAGNCTSELCAVFATSLDGPWTMRNVDSPCTNNAVPFQLKNGSLCGPSCRRDPSPGSRVCFVWECEQS